MTIRVSAADPSLAHFGLAKLDLDLDTMKFAVVDLLLIDTDKRTTKSVRQNSDDLRRAQEITWGFHKFITGSTLVFTEIPSGGQSARAVFSFGLAIGILSACPIQLIQVQPHETKLATVGTKTASKEEMIEWAVENYPAAPWIRARGKANGAIVGANEHLADAIAVAHAGVKTDQFKQLMSIWKATMTQSAAPVRSEPSADVRDFIAGL